MKKFSVTGEQHIVALIDNITDTISVDTSYIYVFYIQSLPKHIAYINKDNHSYKELIKLIINHTCFLHLIITH